MAAPINVYRRNYSLNDTVNTSDYGVAGDPVPSIEEIGWTAPDGFLFKEWNTAQDGSGASFSPGDNSDPFSALYYAIWEEIPQPVKYLTTDQSLTAVANAIRTKRKTSEQLVYPEGFVSAINDIHAGGATITDTTDSHGRTIRNIDTENATTIEPLSVTTNGTYTATTGKAYSPVTVNVSCGGLNISGHKYFSIPFSCIPREAGTTNQIQLEGSNEDIAVLSAVISSTEYVPWVGGGYAQNSDGVSYIYIDPSTQVAGSHIDLSWFNVYNYSSNFDPIDLSLNAATKILYISYDGENFGLEGDIDILDGAIIVDLSEYET